jgi:predicted metalloprotease with PDZ domain
LDAFASIAANQDNRRARDWRDVEDTTRDPIITDRRPKGWVSYQRSEDYYNEGLLIWLEVDATLRARTGGSKGMQDFVRQFVAGPDSKWDARPFTFNDIVSVLNSLSPYDWASFLKERINGKAANAPLSGLTLGGYRLVYASEPTSFFRDQEKRSGEVNLNYSLGISVGKGGHVSGVIWDAPAFKAGLTTAADILAVNGRTYSDDILRDAVVAAEGGKDPIKLEKIGVGETSLDKLLAPQP